MSFWKIDPRGQMSHLPPKGKETKSVGGAKVPPKIPHASHTVFPRSAFWRLQTTTFLSLSSSLILINQFMTNFSLVYLHSPTKGVVNPYSSLHDFFSKILPTKI